MSDYPKLRNLDVFPFDLNGQRVICLRDPMNISAKMLFLPPRLFYIASLFTGKNSLVDIQAEYMRNFGELIYREKLTELIDELDKHLFLESPHFDRTREEIENRYLSNSVRPAAHAGISYESEPEKLKTQLGSFFLPPEGPGLPNLSLKQEKPLKAVMAPHIDLRRGGHCFAWAYKTLAESSSYDLFIILGTAHSEMKNLFSVSSKDFDTPLGIVHADRDFIELFRKHCSLDIFEEEIIHRNEHTIEFQTVFLKYLFPNEDLKILPVLVGSFHELIVNRIEPVERNEVRLFTDALKTTVALSGKRVCLIASVDLAHIGLRFGDPSMPNKLDLQNLALEDKEMLEKIEGLDKSAFFLNIARDRDRRRICGFSPIYCMLSSLESGVGRLLKYEQSHDSQSGSVVTFASLVIY